jgi:epoxyqueuosine reductase
MMHHRDQDVSGKIVETALACGATLAGIASLASVRNSPSHRSYGMDVQPGTMRSVLVIALEHDEDHPALDWYVGRGGTPGNRILIRIARDLEDVLKEKFAIASQSLPYYVEMGGIFLKDAASEAGLGTIGRNNLLITPRFGPRVRLRALFLDHVLAPTLSDHFEPCNGCDAPCLEACPRNAFTLTRFDATACYTQMNADEAFRYEKSEGLCIRYCRACELACPVGR